MMDIAKTSEIDGNVFHFPKWYMDEHVDKAPSSFWLACINFPDKFEAQERELVYKYIQENDVVLEVGAFIGVVSCLLNRLLSNRKNHVAVELIPRYSKMLEYN